MAAAGTRWLEKLVAALKSIFDESYGYEAFADVIPPTAVDGEWKVLVRMHDVASGRQVALKTVTGKDAATACRGAGYWAAATVLERSTRIPGWAAWSADTYQALNAYESTRTKEIQTAEDVQELTSAVAHAPQSGLLLHKLADALDLKPEHAQALGLYARAVSAHPRYTTARYRMAVSVTTLAREPESWLSQPFTEPACGSGQKSRVRASGLEYRLRIRPGSPIPTRASRRLARCPVLSTTN